MYTDYELMQKLRRCGHLLYHCRGGKDSQERILRHLERCGGGMTQKELQESMHIKPGSLSEVVGKVESAGLVSRERGAQDKRTVLLRLTPLGQARSAQMEKEAQEKAVELFAPLSQSQKAALSEILEILSEAWLANCHCKEHIKEEG